ncbi:MAG: hypothetical protein PHE51_08205 [Eubacteriales bacterium]|nr:hypothetical protein [Eubacteriales bacterium]
MQKNTEKYNRHETLTNNFLVQLAFAIGCAIYAFLLMKGSVTDQFMVVVRYLHRGCFVAFAVLAVVLLFVWLKKGKVNCKSGFYYSVIFSLLNLYLIVYIKYATKFFGGFLYNIMYGEYKTLFAIIGIGAFASFVTYVARDNMPTKKRK